MMIIPLVYILLSRQKKSANQIIFILIIIFTLLLTMLFPVKIGKTAEFDLKFIPIFIGFFYGGSIIGIIGIVTMITMEALTKDSNIFLMLLNYGIILIPFYIFKKWYPNYSLRKKLSLAFLFYLLISVTRFLVIFHTHQTDLYMYLLLFSLVSFITLAFAIYLIEINHLQLFFMEQLQSAEKLNSISQLAASVAHEIRNPMTTIRGFMQLIKDQDNLTAEQKMFIGLTLEELNRTQTIINDFLSLARPNSHDYQLLNTSLLLKEIADFMRPYGMISGTEIFTDIEDGLAIKGSAHEFKQLMINLAKNGIEAMPNGGKLLIKAFSTDSHNKILIRDEGVGLSKAQIKQLGQPYYSTKTKGTGLGLMITFDIIKRMHGTVQIESEERAGSSFTLSFPREQTPDCL